MLKKYNIAIWYLITLLLTGALFLLHFVWQGAGDYSISFPQLAPMLAALLMIKLLRDKDAAYVIKDGLSFRLSAMLWYVLSAALPFALVMICAVGLTFVFDIEYQAWEGTPIFYVLNFIFILLGCIGEEVGWRGYLQPLLQKRFSPLISSVIVGALWGFWHLNYASDIVYWLLFIVTTIEVSIIFTFILNRSNGNIWTAIILHTFFNLANRLFVWERFSTQLMITEIVIFGIAAGAVIAMDRKRFMHKNEKDNQSS